MKELLLPALDFLEEILLNPEVSPELRAEAAFLILEKYYCEKIKSFDVTVKHIKGLHHDGAMEYLQQFSIKQLRTLAEQLNLVLPINISKINIKERIYLCCQGKCSCGSRMTSCIC